MYHISISNDFENFESERIRTLIKRSFKL